MIIRKNLPFASRYLNTTNLLILVILLSYDFHGLYNN